MTTEKIVLPNGMTCLVDARDLPLVEGFAWYAHPTLNGKKRYVRASIRVGDRLRGVYMHRLLLGVRSDQHVDHINGDGLDNRRSNLRVATASQNHANRRYPGSASGYMGVYSRKPGTFYGKIKCRGQQYYTPTYNLAEVAARARDTLAATLFGEFARLNFPTDHASNPMNRPASRHGEHVPVMGTGRHSNTEG